MKHDEMMNIATFEEVVAALLEVSDDRTKLKQLADCMVSLEARLNQLTAYGDKLVEECMSKLNDLNFTASEFERRRIHEEVTEKRNELEKIPPILRKMQEYMTELAKRSTAIAARYH